MARDGKVSKTWFFKPTHIRKIRNYKAEEYRNATYLKEKHVFFVHASWHQGAFCTDF